MSTQCWWIHTADDALLRTVIEESLVESGFSLLKSVEHRFVPFGYSCIWLLSESHAALHTFPEHTAAHLEISSCVSMPLSRTEAILVRRLGESDKKLMCMPALQRAGDLQDQIPSWLV